MYDKYTHTHIFTYTCKYIHPNIHKKHTHTYTLTYIQTNKNI
jgi:hypothetical protein